MAVVVIKKRVPKVVTIVKRSLLSVPVLLSVTPNTGPIAGGTSVTLSGYGFTGANASSLLQPGFTVVNDTTITGVTVAHAAGVVSATVSNASYASAPLASAFTYSAVAAPTVISASLASVPWRATAITLTGTGFVSGATVDMSVDSGSTWTPCTSVTFGSSTSITATTPVQTANKDAAFVKFRVTNPDTQTGVLSNALYIVADLLDFPGKVADWAGDVGVTAPSNLVTNVADQFGNGNDVSASGSASPTLTPTAAPLATSKNYFAFDGVANTLKRTLVTLGTHEIAVFAVARSDAAAAYAGLLMYGGWGNAGNAGLSSNSSGADQNLMMIRNNGSLEGSYGSIAGPAWHRVSAVMRAAGTEEGWIDHVYGAETSAGGTIGTTGTIEIASILGAFFLKADIAEMAIYSTSALFANKLEVERWLYQKWWAGGISPAKLLDLTLSTTTPTTLTAADIVSPQGEVDVGGTLVAGFDAGAGAPGSDTFLFDAATPDGPIEVRYTQAATGTGDGGLVLQVRGVDVLTLDNFIGFETGDDLTWRAWHKLSTGECGLRFSCNGSYTEKFGTTSGSALSAATAAKLGSDTSGANAFQGATYESFQAHNMSDIPTGAVDPEFLVLGDSIGTSFPFDTPAAGFIYSSAARKTAPGISNQCLATSGITDQQARFHNSDYKGRNSVKAIILQGGINDIINLGRDAATWISLYQALINDIRAYHPSAKIYGTELSPARAALTSGQYAIWQAVNQAIAGGGGTPITGLDRVISSHVTTMNDGSDGLAAPYSYDGLHLSQLGKQTVGLAWRTGLLLDGLVT